MRYRYHVDCSTLHVRCSNRGAQKLYLHSLGYHIVETVHQYYQDGADAYYMRLGFARDDLRDKEAALLAQDNEGYFANFQERTRSAAVGGV
jgi:hypothetical protein